LLGLASLAARARVLRTSIALGSAPGAPHAAGASPGASPPWPTASACFTERTRRRCAPPAAEGGGTRAWALEQAPARRLGRPPVGDYKLSLACVRRAAWQRTSGASAAARLALAAAFVPSAVCLRALRRGITR
jgi:hypothetical protein